MPLLELRPDGVVHELHALRLAAHDGVLQLLRGALADNGRHRAVDHEDFVDRDAAAAVVAFEEQLRDHAAQRGGQHGADLRLLVGGKNVDHAVHRFARVVRVQGAENEETSFGRGKRQRDCFEIAHLADQHDVGILAQRGFQSGGEIHRMLRHLALGDDAFLVRVHEFDRLLDGHDVAREVRVDVVHQRRQRRALARAGRAGHQHQAAAQVAEFLDDRRQPEFVERGDACGNQTEHGAESVHLLEIIAAEPVVRVHLVGKVEVALVLEALPVLRCANLAEHVAHFVRSEDFLADRDHVAMPADFRRLSLGEMQIGRPRVDQHFEKLVDVGHGVRSSRKAVSSSACPRRGRRLRRPK